MSDSGQATVTRLFDEYCRAREEGASPDVERLLQKAGSHRAELQGRIRVYDSLHEFADDIEADADLSRAPDSLGRFELHGALGAGGLGRVYLAHDPELDRHVAIKILGRGLGLAREQRTWILNEARSLARLEHPDVVRVFEVGTANDYDYVAMEYVDGPSLADVILHLKLLQAGKSVHDPTEHDVAARQIASRLVPLPARTACLRELASALAYCHNRGVIHRDLKPENVLFDRHGVPKLIDFGLAHQEGSDASDRLQITQQLIGSAAYVAPEQVEHGRTGADPRSDQFSFCTLAYELLALENPFRGETPQEVMQAVERADPRPLRRAVPTAPRDLERLLRHGLQREPDDRYPTMQRLADDLRAVLELRPITVSELPVWRRGWLWVRRNRAKVSMAATLLAMAGIFLIGGYLTRAVRTKNHISDQLARLEPERLSDGDELFEAALDLRALRSEAETFDASLVRVCTLGALGDDVQRSIEAWSRRLGEAFDELGTAATDQSGWRQLFLMDARLCPDCPYNVEERDRGRVFLPWEDLEGTEVALLRQSFMEDQHQMFPVWEPVEIVDRPEPGTYRLRAWEEGDSILQYETDFVVERAWDEPRRIEVSAADSYWLERSALVYQQNYTVPNYAPGASPRTVLVPAFQIAEDPVTQLEFEEFTRATGWTPKNQVARASDDEPVWVDLDSAAAYCAWVGGRLPGILELYLALKHEVIPAPEELPALEWLADEHTITGTNGAYFSYDAYKNSGRIDFCFAMNPARGKVPQVQEEGTQFRVVFPADEPGLHTRLLETGGPGGPVSRNRE